MSKNQLFPQIKSSLRNYIFISLLLCITLMLTACGSGPPKDACKKAIQASIQRNPPVLLADTVGGIESVEVNSVEIIDIGKSQKMLGTEYWPVKARVSGYCKIFFTKQPKSFNKVKKFALYKNRFGEWEAQHKGL